MKYLKVIIEPIKIKGDAEDPEQLQADLYERITAMIEAETLPFHIDEEDDDGDED
jgi:hypothetical protein